MSALPRWAFRPVVAAGIAAGVTVLGLAAFAAYVALAQAFGPAAGVLLAVFGILWLTVWLSIV